MSEFPGGTTQLNKLIPRSITAMRGAVNSTNVGSNPAEGAVNEAEVVEASGCDPEPKG